MVLHHLDVLVDPRLDHGLLLLQGVGPQLVRRSTSQCVLQPDLLGIQQVDDAGLPVDPVQLVGVPGSCRQPGDPAVGGHLQLLQLSLHELGVDASLTGVGRNLVHVDLELGQVVLDLEPQRLLSRRDLNLGHDGVLLLGLGVH